MNHLIVSFIASCLALVFALKVQAAEQASRLNVLLFVVDDLNDWISLLDDKAPIQTPNLERLASRGMLFTRAYCMSPACNPSRASTWTGLRPTSTGVYGNKSDWRSAMPHRPTVMQRFRENGYQVKGAGKIFHHHLNGAFHDDTSYDDFRHMRPQLYPLEKLNHSPEYGSRNTDWGSWPKNERDAIDVQTADYCIETIQNSKDDQPLLLTCGIFKPHSPFFAPEKYHKPYQDIALPNRQPEDWNDLPAGARALFKSKAWFWKGMQETDLMHPGAYQAFIESYAACVHFADTQIGRVLDALDQSPFRDQTIIVLWSDHGFHLGEKNHIEKFMLWEKSTHIPFIIAAPGITKPGDRCGHPVDMSVLYPTLLELCRLPPDETCDGESVVPLLKNPKGVWERPALMTYLQGNHAVKDTRFRYIRYADGTEELYDHEQDPNEWTNLANNHEWDHVKSRLSQWFPKNEARPIHDLKVKK